MAWNAEVLNERWKAVNPKSVYKNCAKCGVAFTTSTKRELCFDCRKHDRKTVYKGKFPCPRCGRTGYAYLRYTKEEIVEIDVIHRVNGKVKHCRFYGLRIQDFLHFIAHNTKSD